MPAIFISYRRSDSQADAGRIYDRLADHFGKTSIIYGTIANECIDEDVKTVILEDITTNESKLIEKLYESNKHVIQTLQYPSNNVRINLYADYVFLFSEPVARVRRKLYNQYGNIFTDFESFSILLEQLTSNNPYACMVIRNQLRAK